jgi:hypothetical protein
MLIRRILVAGVIFVAFGIAQAEDAKPKTKAEIQAYLDKAKAEYKKTLDDKKAALLAAYDTEMKAFQTSKDLDNAVKLAKAKKSFEEGKSIVSVRPYHPEGHPACGCRRRCQEAGVSFRGVKAVRRGIGRRRAEALSSDRGGVRRGG